MPFYTGSFIALLNPFALLCGILSLAMVAMHGANFLNLKLEGEMQNKALHFSKISSLLTIILFALGGVLIATYIDGYSLQSIVAHDGPSNPLYKSVINAKGAWLQNYKDYSWTIAIPLLGCIGALASYILSKSLKVLAFISSGISILGIIATVGTSMFPFILPSSSNPSQSLIVWDSSSSQLTLFIMLIAVAIFLPIILAYTSWVYKVMSGKVTAEYIENNKHDSY